MLHEMEIASSTNQWNGMKDLNTAQRTFHFRLVNYDNSSARFIPGIIDMGVIVLSHISRTCVYNVYTICIHKMYIQYVYTIYIYVKLYIYMYDIYIYICRIKIRCESTELAIVWEGPNSSSTQFLTG